jgi:hypothetical protein
MITSLEGYLSFATTVIRKRTHSIGEDKFADTYQKILDCVEVGTRIDR